MFQISIQFEHHWINLYWLFLFILQTWISVCGVGNILIPYSIIYFDDWIENYWFVNICSFVLYNVNQSNIINDCDASKADHLFKMCNSKTCIENETSSILIDWFGFMLFNATLNSISVKSWRSVLLVDETGVTRENHRPATIHWQTLAHNVVSSTLHLSRIRTHNFSDYRHWLHR